MADSESSTNRNQPGKRELSSAPFSPVSVVIPYSPAHTPDDLLERALESVRAQSIDTEEIVITDTEQRGPAWARNRGLARASHRMVGFLDADDIWFDDKLERQLKAVKRSGAGICVQGEPMSQSRYARELFLGNIASIMSSVLIDTTKVDARFDESLERREDHLFVIEGAAQAGLCLCDQLFEVGGHAESLSSETPTLYRLRQDYRFAKRVGERAPSVGRSIRDYYDRPRCDPVHPNTAGDILRTAFLWPGFRAVLGVAASVVCQRLKNR
jgi:glycosyltransferase involved in cell wall biosynthesis